MTRRVVLVFALLVFLVACPPTPPVPINDVTDQLVKLENPYLHPDPFSRNVWDLQTVQDRVLIASGDAWKNTGTNIKKIDVVSYSSNGFFAKEFTTDDEQIHRFVLSGDRVLIPGFDPLEDWSLGNFYTLETKCLAPIPCWRKTRTIPFGVHTYDLIEFEGKLFSTIGGFDDEVQPGLLESFDNGQTWNSVTGSELKGLTLTRLFVFGGELYAAGEFRSDGAKGLAKYSNGMFSSAGLPDKNFIPNQPKPWRGRLGRITTFKNRLLYTASGLGNNVGFAENAYSTNLSQTKPIPLRDAEYPTDFMLLENGVAMLTSSPNGAEFINRVYVSTDGETFTEQFSFRSNAFARSFERLGTTWIFGLGCFDTGSCDGAGILLRLM